MLDQLQSFFAVYGEYQSSWGPAMARAVAVTLKITAGAFALGLALGLGAALMRLSRSRMLRNLALGYIELMRGVPALVLLFLLYFGLAPVGIVLDAVPAAILGLGLSAGGYIAEIFRSGIEATHSGQREAGMTVGLTPLQVYRHIILPQALRVSLPPLVSMLITVLKDSSLASLISAPEIMLRAKNIASSDFMPLHIFVLAGLLYLLLSIPLSIAGSRLERRMSRHRRVQD